MLRESDFAKVAVEKPEGIDKFDYSFEVDYKYYLMNVVTSQLLLIENHLKKLGYRLGDEDLTFTRIQTMVRESSSGYTATIRYKLLGENVSVLSEFMVTENDALFSSLVTGGSGELSYSINQLTEGLLRMLRESVVRDLNLVNFNKLLSMYKPRSCPYTVQFAIGDKGLKVVSGLSENLIVWTVTPDLFVNLSDLYIGRLVTENRALFTNYFYSYISVIDYMVNSDKDLFYGYLVSHFEVSDRLSVLPILKQFSVPLIEDKKQNSRVLYSVDGDIITIYNLLLLDKVGRRHNRVYVEQMKVHNTTWEISVSENPFVYDVTSSGLRLRFS